MVVRGSRPAPGDHTVHRLVGCPEREGMEGNSVVRSSRAAAPACHSLLERSWAPSHHPPACHSLLERSWAHGITHQHATPCLSDPGPQDITHPQATPCAVPPFHVAGPAVHPEGGVVPRQRVCGGVRHCGAAGGPAILRGRHSHAAAGEKEKECCEIVCAGKKKECWEHSAWAGESSGQQCLPCTGVPAATLDPHPRAEAPPLTTPCFFPPPS